MYEALVKGIGLGFLLSLSVGPVIFTIIKLSLKMGHKAGYAFVAGVSLSDFMLIVFGNMAAELVRSLLRFEFWIGLTGAGLLIGMGIYSFFYGKDPTPDNSEISFEFRKRDLARFTLQGFFMNTLNPAPIFFWLTTCTALAYLPLQERILMFGICLATILSFDLAKVLLAGRIRTLLTPRTLHIIHQVSAVLLVAFGLLIVGGLLLRK
jgi:threonine/homoserine/homoserine lactone efflux protein